MSCYGGPIETPNIDRIAARGVRYTQWHTTALCSPTRSCLLTGRNHTRNSMACITELASGFPNASGVIPPENGTVAEILGEAGWNTYMVGKWHLTPDHEMNLAATKRNWPTESRLRTLLRLSRRRDEPVVSGARLRQPPRRTAQRTGGGLPPHRGHHRQGARVHQGRQGGRAGQAVLPLLRTRRLPRAAPRATGVDRPLPRAASTSAMRRSANRPWPARRRSGSSRRTRSSRRSTRSARPRPALARTASRTRSSTGADPGARCRTTRSGSSAVWPRCTRGSCRTPTIRSAACSTTWRRPSSWTTRSSSWSPTTGPAERAVRTDRSTR